MSLPSKFSATFSSNANLTFNENSNAALASPVDGSYIVIASDSTPVFRSKLSDANTIAYGLSTISSFVANAGMTYRVEIDIRKTNATSSIISWLRPGFDVFSSDDFTNTTVLVGATFGEGLTGYGEFVDSANWEINKWYTIGANWTADQDYPHVRPRIRINRNPLDVVPYSDVIYEIGRMESLPELKLSEIIAEFGGNSPAKLSNYYRKSILPAITVNFSDTQTTLYSFLTSEALTPVTNFANGVAYFTTDGGDFGPRNDLSPFINEGSISLVTDATYGQVLQSQGIVWGGVVQAKAFGPVSYQKLQSGTTYTLTAKKKVVSDPTNTANAPQMYIQLWCYDATGKYIGSYDVPRTPLQLTAAMGWTDITGTFTLANITSTPALASAVYVRPYSYDNLYAYTNGVGTYVPIICNCVVQTASISITPSGTSDIGINKIYDVTGGVDHVYVLSGSTWTIDPAQSIKDLGYPRQATNPYTNRVTRIGNFYVVDTAITAPVPTSGQIKFSDFLGTAQTAGPIWLTPAYLGDFTGNNPFSVSVTAYSTTSSSVYFSYGYLPGGISNVVTFANTVTIGGLAYLANTIVFSGTTEYTIDQTYPIGWNIEVSDPYITINRDFYYNTINYPPVWSTSSGSLGTFSNGSPVPIVLAASDPNTFALEYTLANGTSLPSGLSLSLTGTISGTLSASAGTYNFVVSASDGAFSTNRDFSIGVTASLTVVQTNLNGLDVSGQGTNYLPAPPTVGNLLVAIGAEYTGIHSINSGWSPIYDVGEGTDNLVAAYRIVQPGDTNALNWLYTGGGSHAGMVGMWEISGYDTNLRFSLLFQNQSSVTSGVYSPVIGATTYTNEIVLSLTESSSGPTFLVSDPAWTTDQYANPVIDSVSNSSVSRTGLMSHKIYSPNGTVTQSIGFGSVQTGEMAIVSVRLL